MTTDWLFGTIRGDAGGTPLSSPVLKIGGSLLAKPDWPLAIAALLARIDQPLVVVGGGSVVAGLRALDAACPRPADLMHDLAIHAMTLTARLVADALGLSIVDDPKATGPAVLDVSQWLATADPPPDLPTSWDVTSDSLAAAAAVACGRGLTLAKCVPPAPKATLQSLADSGWADPWFPKAAADVETISWAAPCPHSPPPRG
jgi:hypothetical protein